MSLRPLLLLSLLSLTACGVEARIESKGDQETAADTVPAVQESDEPRFTRVYDVTTEGGVPCVVAEMYVSGTMGGVVPGGVELECDFSRQSRELPAIQGPRVPEYDVNAADEGR